MAGAPAEDLAFVGSQFASTNRPSAPLQLGATGPAIDPLRSGNNGNQQEDRVITSGDDGGRRQTPMERFLACDNQPLQITVAKPPTKDGKGE